MLKRIRWIMVGVGLAAGGQVWAKRKVAHLLKRYSPPQVATRAASNARNELRAAISEGRVAMRRREDELRGVHGSSPGGSSASNGGGRPASNN